MNTNKMELIMFPMIPITIMILINNNGGGATGDW